MACNVVSHFSLQSIVLSGALVLFVNYLFVNDLFVNPNILLLLHVVQTLVVKPQRCSKGYVILSV